MNNIFYIFINIISPIFIQIFAGFILQKKFKIDINSLVKVQFYIIIPCLMFTNIYSSEIDSTLFFKIALCCLIIFTLLYIISYITVKLLKYPVSLANAFINSICFYNGGNYCIPLFFLLYNSSSSISIQAIIMMIQNITLNTIGIFNTKNDGTRNKEIIIGLFKIPILYSIFFAIVFRFYNIEVWKPIWNAMSILSEGMVAIALITLGAQLANCRLSLRFKSVYLSNFIRLIIGPIIAYLVVGLMNIKGMAAQVMIISAAAPTAVNTVLLSIEYNNEPDFSTQAVVSSTLLSSITVSIVIFFVTKYII